MAREFINKQDISDVLIERPISFSINEKYYSVYPASLGKIQLTSRLLEAARIGMDAKDSDIHASILVSSREHRAECIRLIAYSTLPGSECLDENKVAERIKEFEVMKDTDIASVVFLILTMDKTKQIIKQFSIDIESQKIEKVTKVKKQDKNTLSFGGRSVWGAMIDAACERYGWSYQYVLWGISYSNLQLMLADQVRTVFLSDKERKQVHLPNDNVVVRADNPAELGRLIETQSWK